MYCDSESGMATLLQQKNCIALSNSTVGVNNSDRPVTNLNKNLISHEMVGLPVSSLTSNSALSSEHSLNNINEQPDSQYHNSINCFSNINDTNMYLSNSSTVLNTSNTVASTNNLNSALYYNNLNHHQTIETQNILHYDNQNGFNNENYNVTENNLESRNNTSNDIVMDGQNLEEEEETEPPREIDIVINNVVCSFSVRCHLNLREIALNGFNVEFRRENGMVTMKLRKPYTTASIWSSGRITCTGATSEEHAKIAARRYARCLQKLGFSVKFRNFRVVNVLGTCSMPWSIKIVNFSEKFKKDASYEPELHPGVTYKLKTPKATLKIFSTGSITVTANSVADVQTAIEHIYPLVYEFRKERPVDHNISTVNNKKRKHPLAKPVTEPSNDVMYVSDQEQLIDTSEDEEDESY